jgi:hypothetical protein
MHHGSVTQTGHGFFIMLLPKSVLKNAASELSASVSQVKSPLQGSALVQGLSILLLPKSILKVAASELSVSVSQSKLPAQSLILCF